MTMLASEKEATQPLLTPVYQYPESLTHVSTHYCPGCTHGIAHRLIAEVIDELGIRQETIGVASVGCSVFSYRYFATDFAQAPHGRAPAVATGIKRVRPDRIVFTYQGDGDLASIGAAEILHAAVRGDPITVFFLNNAIYGMTGGQMAPTTLPGQKTSSSPLGRDPATSGAPLRMSELLAQVDGAAYVVRRSLHDVVQIRRAKKAIRQAFEVQRQGLGLAMVELLSSCPTNWGLKPEQALAFIRDEMVPAFPLGDYKSPGDNKTPGDYKSPGDNKTPGDHKTPAEAGAAGTGGDGAADGDGAPASKRAKAKA